MDNEEYKRKALELIVNYIESVMASYSKEELEARIKKALPERESEDERIRKMLIDVYKRADMGGEIFGKGITYKQVIAWLEKQKEQKPAEWSEEDRKTLDAIIKRYSFSAESDFSVFVGEDKLVEMKKEFEWLRNLQYKCTWKPSEEQMEALRRAFNTGSIGFSDMEKLATLYEDIKIEIL